MSVLELVVGMKGLIAINAVGDGIRLVGIMSVAVWSLDWSCCCCCCWVVGVVVIGTKTTGLGSSIPVL